MQWELLDTYSNYHEINDLGQVRYTVTGQILENEWHVNKVCCMIKPFIGGETVRAVPIAKTVAEYFVPNPKGLTLITHLDGNETNCKASNLKWVQNYKEADLYSHGQKMDKETAKDIRIKINNAIDAGDWLTARTLGKLLPFDELASVRPAPSYYEPIPRGTKMKSSSPILRVFTEEEGTLDYCTAREVTERYGIKASKVYSLYSEPPCYSPNTMIYLEVIAMVSKYFANAQIDTIKDGEIIETLSYTETAVKHGIHLEDLADLLYTSDSEPLTWNGYEFKVNADHTKKPTIY